MNLFNTIIYSDSLNETEFLRTLSKLGIKTLGVRVMDSYGLSLYILAKFGKNKKGVYLNNEEQDFVYYNLLKPSCFNDATNIRSAINSFRDTANGNSYQDLDQYLNKAFMKKTQTIKEAFEKYSEYKKQEDSYDLYDLLYELNGGGCINLGNVIYFDDMPFSPLAVLTFAKYFNLEAKKLSTFIKQEEHGATKATACYGKNNEISNFINKINNSVKLDQCLVTLIDPNDAAELTNELNRYSIPYTTSLGFHFAQTDIGKFVAKLQYMNNKGWGIEAYQSLFDAAFFNANKYTSQLVSKKDKAEFIKYLGWLRPNFDSPRIVVDNSLYQNVDPLILQAIQSVCDEINDAHHRFDFIKNNIVASNNNFEAEKLLDKYQTYMNKYGVSFDVIVEILLGSQISSHISTSGALHICSLLQAFSSIRDNVFIIGLDSSFPGNPKENYLIYDEEFIKMGATKYVSSEIVKSNKATMELLISLSKNCYLSYSYFNLIENKNINPSSVIQDLGVAVEEFSYAKDVLSPNTNIINGFNQGGYSLTNNTHALYSYNPNIVLNKEFRPSEFNNYFVDEYKLSFIIKYIFGVSIDEEEDPYEVISPRDMGTVFHKAVEKFEQKNISLQQFVDNGLKLYDEFIAKKPPVLANEAIKARNKFKEGLTNFYVYDPNNRHVYSEYELQKRQIYGVKFGGTFDRLEIDANNKYILVDYKTSDSYNKHDSNDAVSCMQGLIYAEMIEKELKITVDRCVFRYPFIKSESYIMFDQNNRDELKRLLEQFVDDIKAGTILSLSKEDKYIDQYMKLVSLMKELKR